MSAQVSREICLKARPTGLPTKDDFELASVEVKAPAEGQVQVRNLWMSVDPYMRARMIDRPSYVPPFQLGQPLQGAAVGEVVASRYPAFKSGDLVRSMFGWRETFNAPAKAIEKIDLRGLPMQTFLGAAGGPGLDRLCRSPQDRASSRTATSSSSPRRRRRGRLDRLPDRQDQGPRRHRLDRRRRQVRLPERTRCRPRHRLQGDEGYARQRSAMPAPHGHRRLFRQCRRRLISRRRSRSPGRSPASRSAA